MEEAERIQLDVAPGRISSPEEMKLAVRRAFRRMPEQRALIAFAQVMTAAVSPELKLAAWEGVRYLHIWWMLDEVLTGDVLENPVVQTAFADAVPVRKWRVAQRCPGWKELAATLPVPADPFPATPLRQLIAALTHGEDAAVATSLGDCPPEMARATLGDSPPALVESARTYIDLNGNNLLWYLTYRDDCQAVGGFACPHITRQLLRWGVDPTHRNNLGLCWNDVARHVNPT